MNGLVCFALGRCGVRGGGGALARAGLFVLLLGLYLLLAPHRAAAAPQIRQHTPLGAAEIVAIAAHPVASGRVAIADRAGRVWISDDAGRSWRVERLSGTLGSPPSAEDLLRDVDARFEELITASAPIDSRGRVGRVPLRDRRVREELLADVELTPGFTYRRLPGGLAAPLQLAWRGSDLLAGRHGTWWRLDRRDGGWAPLRDGAPPPTDVGVAVGSIGVASPNPSASAQERWVIRSSGLFRSTDGGSQFDAVLRGRPDLRAVVSPSPGRAVLIDGRSLSLTEDGGVRFRPLTGAPVGLERGALARCGDDRVWIAVPDGLWLLDLRAAPQVARQQDFLSIGDLVAAATARDGLERVRLRARRGLLALVPSLVAQAGVGPVATTEFGPLGTRTRTERAGFVQLRAVWRPRQPRSVHAAVRASDLDLIVVDGQPLILTGVDDYVAASFLDRAAHRYGAQLTARIVELYRVRGEWLARRDAAQASSLPERVHVALAVAEVEALLDAYSGGAVVRHLAEPSVSSSEL